jgi:hypothetical protein
MLKENAKIDSLFNTIIPECKVRCNYFSFTVIKLENEYSFSVLQLMTKKNEIYFPFMLPEYMTNFGYFEYRGCTVFISGGIDPYYFFQKTQQKKSFKFIWDKNNTYDERDDLFFNSYSYHHGKFAINISQLQK